MVTKAKEPELRVSLCQIPSLSPSSHLLSSLLPINCLSFPHVGSLPHQPVPTQSSQSLWKLTLHAFNSLNTGPLVETTRL